MNSSMPWVKMYTEMLDDTKVLRLTEVCRWRFVQLILMAGECDAEGLLTTTTGPMSLDDIARRLRIPPYLFTKQMNSLLNVGLVERTQAGYRVVKFSERQGRKQSEKREQWRTAQQKVRHAAPAAGPVWANDEPTTSEVVAKSLPTNSELTANSLRQNAEKPLNLAPVINDGLPREEEEKSRERGADAPTPRSKEKPKPSYPAVDVYRAAAGINPDRTLWDSMNEAIGTKPDDLAFWGKVVSSWVARGHNKRNLEGMFDWYQKREIPNRPYERHVPQRSPTPEL